MSNRKKAYVSHPKTDYLHKSGDVKVRQRRLLRRVAPLVEDDEVTRRAPGKAKNRKNRKAAVVHNPDGLAADLFGNAWRLAFRHEVDQLLRPGIGAVPVATVVNGRKMVGSTANINVARERTLYLPASRAPFTYVWRRLPTMAGNDPLLPARPHSDPKIK